MRLKHPYPQNHYTMLNMKAALNHALMQEIAWTLWCARISEWGHEGVRFDRLLIVILGLH